MWICVCVILWIKWMSNAYAEHTWILTIEQFFGLKCPEVLGSSKSAQHMNPVLFPHAVFALTGSFPLLPFQQQQKQNSPTILLCLLLPCPVVFYLNLLQGLVCTKCAWAGWIGLYLQLNRGHGQRAKKIVQGCVDAIRGIMCGKELMLHLVSLVTETLQKVEGISATSIRGSYRLLAWVFLLVCYSVLILPIWALFLPIYCHCFQLLASGGMCCFFLSLSWDGSWSFHLPVHYNVKYINCPIFCAHALVCRKHTLCHLWGANSNSAVRLRGLGFLCSQQGRR